MWVMQNKKEFVFGKEIVFTKLIQLYIFMNMCFKCSNITKNNESYMPNK